MEPTMTTASIALAAYLMHSGFDLPRLEIIGRNDVQMRFADPDREGNRLAGAFFGGARVAARDYYRAVRTIRRLINAATENGVRR